MLTSDVPGRGWGGGFTVVYLTEVTSVIHISFVISSILTDNILFSSLVFPVSFKYGLFDVSSSSNNSYFICFIDVKELEEQHPQCPSV